MADTAYVTKLPNCDFCKIEQGKETPATYDAATLQGPWASMCDEHYIFNRRSSLLGTGRGQRYVVGEPPARDRQAEFNDAVERGDIDAMSEAVGDGDPADFM